MTHEQMATQDLAKMAYEAYANHTNWKSLATGQPLPQWDQLSDAIRDAWRASSECVASKLRGRGAWLHEVDSAVTDPDPDSQI